LKEQLEKKVPTMIIENLDRIFKENKINLKDFIASLQPNLGVDAIFGSLNREYNYDANRLMSAVFEMADDLIHAYPSTKEKYYSKGFVKRTIIFKNGCVTFKRRKYYVRPEYYSSITRDQKATVFLLDKYIGIEKYQRLDFDFAIDIISEIGVNLSYQDIANKFEQSGITKQTVFGLMKKLSYSDLLERILETPVVKLKHNGVIYFENDDTFQNARCKGNILKLKAITMGVCHTGYVDENAKRKQMNNRRFFIKTSNEECNFNTEEYWKAVKKFIYLNYEDAENAHIVVVGDGAGKIRACEKWNDWEFIIDRFHIKKRVRDAVRGNSKYKDRASEVIWMQFADMIEPRFIVE
jgi:hypothetical protein